MEEATPVFDYDGLVTDMHQVVRDFCSPVTRLALALTCRREYRHRPACSNYWLCSAEEQSLAPDTVRELAHWLERAAEKGRVRVGERLIHANLQGVFGLLQHVLIPRLRSCYHPDGAGALVKQALEAWGKNFRTAPVREPTDFDLISSCPNCVYCLQLAPAYAASRTRLWPQEVEKLMALHVDCSKHAIIRVPEDWKPRNRKRDRFGDWYWA